jgi:hypothetical protein
MSVYIKKLIGYFSNIHHRLRNRKELLDYAIDEKEYFNDFLKYEVSFLNELKRRSFHTVDYPNTGTYDFHFGIQSVQLNFGIGNNSLFNEVVRIYIDILPEGTVEISSNESELFEINQSLISNHDYGWEIENEINDIVKDIIILNLPELVINTCLFDIVEFYYYYPPK